MSDTTELCLMLISADNHVEWAGLMQAVLSRSPLDWRRSEATVRELRQHINYLWHIFYTSFNFGGGSVGEAVRLAEMVTFGGQAR